MAREQYILLDANKLQEYLSSRLELEIDAQVCRELSERRAGYDGPVGCVDSSCASSAGPIIWLQNRLIEKRLWHRAGHSNHEPEDGDLFFVVKGQAHLYYRHFLASYARSKMFTTNLFPSPIDLTSARVSVCPFSG